MVNTKVKLSGIELKNPIITASGTFGFGKEFGELYDLNCLGGISVKGTTLNARFGNPTPRIAECKAGILNSVGLQNPGIDSVLKNELPSLRKSYDNLILLNVGGFSVEEFATCVKKANDSTDFDIIELNISCPNVHKDGKNFGTDVNSAKEIMRAIRKETTKPIYVKLTPNVTNISEIAKAMEGEGADGLSLINTLLGMRIDVRRKAPVLKNIMGGYSGEGIFPVAVRCVYQVAKAVKIPLIGMGGVSTAYDVIELMMAGATAVQVGTANLIEPYAAKNIVESLPKVMKELKINDINEIIGAVL